jgi:hypothetical protein
MAHCLPLKVEILFGHIINLSPGKEKTQTGRQHHYDMNSRKILA